MNHISNAIEAQLDSGTIRISTVNRHLDKPVKGYEPLAVASGEEAIQYL